MKKTIILYFFCFLAFVTYQNRLNIEIYLNDFIGNNILVILIILGLLFIALNFFAFLKEYKERKSVKKSLGFMLKIYVFAIVSIAAIHYSGALDQKDKFQNKATSTKSYKKPSKKKKKPAKGYSTHKERKEAKKQKSKKKRY